MAGVARRFEQVDYPLSGVEKLLILIVVNVIKIFNNQAIAHCKRCVITQPYGQLEHASLINAVFALFMSHLLRAPCHSTSKTADAVIDVTLRQQMAPRVQRALRNNCRNNSICKKDTLATYDFIYIIFTQKTICCFESSIDALPADLRQQKMKYLSKHSSFLSEVTFWWENWLFKAGYKKIIEVEDLGSIPEIHTSTYNHERFRKVLDREKVKLLVLNHSCFSLS